MNVITLTAQDGARIVGFLAADGSIREFQCKHLFRDGEHHFFYEIGSEDWGTDTKSNGDIVLIDESGRHWQGKDVQNAYILQCS